MNRPRPWLALPGVLLLTGCTVLSPFIAQTGIVPWVSTTPASSVAPTAVAIPAGVRQCDVSQLVVSAATEGAGGTTLVELTLTVPPQVFRPCSLAGPPAQFAIERTDRTRDLPIEYSTSDRPGPGNGPRHAAPVLLQPGMQASLDFIWTNWCGGKLPPIRFRFRMSDAAAAPDGISNAVDDAYGSPRCDLPGSPSRVVGYAVRVPNPPDVMIDVAIHAPSAAMVGSQYAYAVTLTNNDVRPASFDPCPEYQEGLELPKPPGPHEERWLLNCETLPKLMWPDDSTEFAMQIAIPPDTPIGSATLSWTLFSQTAGGSAETQIQVIAQ
jgi:hypothetical protein